MKHRIEFRGLTAVLSFVLIASVWPAPPAGAQPSGASPTAPSTPAPPAPIGPAAIPSPIASLPPASQAEALPYPAYGTPAPGVGRGVPSALIPQIVSLDQAVAIGFASSPLLAQARAVVEIDTAPLDLAKTALFPSLSASASTTRDFRQPGTLSSSSSNVASLGAQSTSNGVALTLTQLIYDGGRVAAELRAARATQNSAVATYERQLQTVAYGVANAYYAALAAQRATQVALETLKINQVNADLVAAQIQTGTAARSDLLTAELPVAQARVTLVQDQGAELSAQAAFVNAMGLDANTYALPQDDGNVLAGTSTAPTVSVPSYDQAITRALLLRPDYAAAQYVVVSDQANLHYARLGLFPHLDGSAGFGTTSSNAGGGAFRNNGDVGVTLTIPIFDQGVTHAQIEQAQGELDQAVAQLQNAKLGVELNVKQTLVSLISARAAFGQTQAELANAREVLQATQAQYAAGVTTLPLLLNAESGLTTALVAQVTAVYALRQAEAAFLYAEGTNAPA